jgi:hypothetical protein
MKLPLLSLAALLSSAVATEEASYHHNHKHHKHHRKHPHDDNGEVGHDHYTVNKVTYKVSTNSTIIHLPPTAEEKSAVDAVNAYNAANSARQAASVANHVAMHSIDVKNNAQDALTKAQAVLKEARTETAGLKVDQKDALRRAEKKLNTAAEAVNYETTDLKYKSRASDRKVLEYKMGSMDYDGSESELARMRAEIEALRHEMEAKKAKEHVAARAREIETSEKELAELEIMIKEYEEAEAKREVKAGEHDEMKIELEKLRARVKEIEEEEGQPDTGSLTYEIPPRRTVPLRTVRAGDSRGFEGPKSVPAEESTPDEPCDDTSTGIDIDTEMPYGELEPFGREDTAQELTEQSIQESDEMVDQLERAEVAEEKRAVFRALTRLRGAAITSYDGIARSQTGNIDEYNKIHKWRRTHPLHHLADEESDISKWAFPDNADF